MHRLPIARAIGGALRLAAHPLAGRPARHLCNSKKILNRFLGRELRTRLKAYCTTVQLSDIADLGEALLEWKNLLALVLVCGGIWLVTRDAPAPKDSAPSATPAK